MEAEARSGGLWRRWRAGVEVSWSAAGGGGDGAGGAAGEGCRATAKVSGDGRLFLRRMVNCWRSRVWRWSRLRRGSGCGAGELEPGAADCGEGAVDAGGVIGWSLRLAAEDAAGLTIGALDFGG